MEQKEDGLTKEGGKVAAAAESTPGRSVKDSILEIGETAR